MSNKSSFRSSLTESSDPRMDSALFCLGLERLRRRYGVSIRHLSEASTIPIEVIEKAEREAVIEYAEQAVCLARGLGVSVKEVFTAAGAVN
tara:strand:+ start:2372 stop:2644 length:273 start_codon:yes stop_codon:yes gene_type:complete